MEWGWIRSGLDQERSSDFTSSMRTLKANKKTNCYEYEKLDSTHRCNFEG